jgi:hypothetical protein
VWVFEGESECLNFWQVVATTTDRRLNFRVFNERVDQDTLFEYLDADGLIEVRGTGTKCESGFRWQVVNGRTFVEAYKSWPGTSRKFSLGPNGDVTIRRRRSDGMWVFNVYFAATGHEKVRIPWGIGKYIEDPASFFQSLGISRASSGGYTRDVVDLDSDGILYVKMEFFDMNRMLGLRQQIAIFLDLNNTVVCSCHFEDEVSPGQFQEMGDEIGQEDLSDGVQGNTLLIVVADVLLTCLGIGLIGLVICWRRSKGRNESPSSVSRQSSSDECRHEGLLETDE